MPDPLVILVFCFVKIVQLRKKRGFLEEGIRDWLAIRLSFLICLDLPSEMSRTMSRYVSFRGWRHISSRYVIVVIERIAVSILYLIFTVSPAGTLFPRQSVAVSSKWTGNGCELIKGISFKLIKCIYMFAFLE